MASINSTDRGWSDCWMDIHGMKSILLQLLQYTGPSDVLALCSSVFGNVSRHASHDPLWTREIASPPLFCRNVLYIVSSILAMSSINSDLSELRVFKDSVNVDFCFINPGCSISRFALYFETACSAFVNSFSMFSVINIDSSRISS